MSDNPYLALRPDASTLIKLGSALIHAEEFLSPKGHPHDKVAFVQLMDDIEVKTWLDQMSDLAFLPVKR